MRITQILMLLWCCTLTLAILSNNNHVATTYVPQIQNKLVKTVTHAVPTTVPNVPPQAAPEASTTFMHTPTSVFFANYNSQQNVLALGHSIERRLSNIRNVEMRVATIQEIFDSIHFNSNTPIRNYSLNAQSRNFITTINSLKEDLRVFSKRLLRKLEKATSVVNELRDFLRFNISTLMLQRNFDAPTSYNDDEDFDVEIDDIDSENSVHDENGIPKVHLYLNTFIQTLQNLAGIYAQQQQQQMQLHYNKQKIQILNYMKTDDENMDDIRTFPIANSAHANNERSIEANNIISEKIRSIKKNLATKADADNAAGFTNVNNSKFKLLGNHFKHIYFLSRSDHASDHLDRYYYDLHFRHLYASAIKQKFVLLLFDVGSAMNIELQDLAREFVQNILQLLSETDMISIISVSNETQIMYLDEFGNSLQQSFYYATRSRKEEIMNYINNLSATKAFTNHSLGFESAFEHLTKLQNESLLTTANPIEFVYITRGLLTNLSDAMHVLNVIANRQATLLEPIIINICAVVLDEKRLMYEKQFLSDIATQNYTKYDIKVDDWYKNKKKTDDYLIGKFFVLTKTETAKIIRASTAVFDSIFEERYLMKSLNVHLPSLDESSKEVLVSMTHAVSPFGVVGVNLYLADLIEDVVTYGQTTGAAKQDYNYAFLIDRNGVTLAHPAFPRPFAQTFPVDIGFLENSTDFFNIRRKMLQTESGNISTTIYVTSNKRSQLLERTYHWQSILGIYVICLVSTNKRELLNRTLNYNAINNKSIVVPLILQQFTIKENKSPPPSSVVHQAPPLAINNFQSNDYTFVSTMDLVYHRLDLLPTNIPAAIQQQQQQQLPHIKVCRYFRQTATMDAATLFLSPSAFESPFTFLHNSKTSSSFAQARIAESIMAYLKDTTGLLANPGLRPNIRNEVNALYHAMQYLKKRHQDARGSFKNHIIRRYIATVSGVLQVYPGCLLTNNYDATRRPWFRKAMQLPGRIITTEPYLDAGGAGYIITIAHTIFEGKSNALHSIERDEPVAVVAIDVPYAFYYKMILETTPLCQLPNIKCLLFENEGYLVAHPSMLEPSTLLKNSRRPHEHLTHKESYLANDILNHKTLVRKLACANYQNRTLQRYYAFNTSLMDILTNVVHGERTKYAISLVRGSNIFAAVLNSTCDGGAFCPCSTIDRVCLNCNRMDQMDCECPCECPIESDVFADSTIQADDAADDDDVMPSTMHKFSNYTQQYPYCEPPSEHFIALPTTLSNDQILQPCMNINCDIYSTQIECLAVMGCEWCQQDLDGNSFTAAFCTSQAVCFNGVMSIYTPYGDLDDIDIITSHAYNPGQKQNSYSAFGPVGGAIVVLALVIGFAIYFYRLNLDSHVQEQFYVDSMQEENYGLPLSRFNFDDCQAHDDPPGGIGGYDHPAAQRNLIHPADISPYHVSTGSSYRRPPNGESDHGYSTMTPHEDSSDHQCFTLAEPLLLHDKRHSKSDTVSISTSISSPTNRQQQQQPNQPPYPLPQTKEKDTRLNHITSPKKFSPARVYEKTTIPLNVADPIEITQIGTSPHYILAPVTVHRHMETSES